MDLRKQTGTFFQKPEVKRAQSLLLLMLFWLWVSLGLAAELKNSHVFLALKQVLYVKVFLVALLFGGRYLFFPLERWRFFFLWSCGVILIIIAGAYLMHDLQQVSFTWRSCLQLGDIAVWSLVLGGLLEVVAALFRKWLRLKLQPPILRQQWTDLGRDLIKLAFFTLFGLTILYYYLVNLFLVDTFYYSYLAMILFGLCGVVLYSVWYRKIMRWGEREIGQIDAAAFDFFQTDPAAVRDMLPFYQHLVLTRNYLEKLIRPQLVLRCSAWYACGVVWLLALPFIIGFAVPV